jgi:molybdopterin-containing oxidoreductase family membrane subunit
MGLGVLAVGGLAVWLVELSRGMADLGLSQQVVWGLYIAGFFTAAGAGAGALVLVALQALQPWLTAGQQARLMAAGLASFGVAGALIVMDVGSPLGVWRIAVSGRWTSLVVWDFYLLLAGLLVTLVAWLSLTGSRRGMAGRGILAVVMGLVGLTLLLAESWMLTTQSAHPVWESGLTTLSFLAGGAVAALGLAVLLLADQPRERARHWLVIALAASALIVVSEVMVGVLTMAPRASEAARLLITGPLLWLYVVVGLIAPLTLLTMQQTAWTALGAALAVLGVLIEKTQLLAVGQGQPWLPGAAVSYVPTWVEILGVAGLAAAGVVAYGLLARLRAPAR